jgi:transcriptional/translational regulatory protein YebC/TACO1
MGKTKPREDIKRKIKLWQVIVSGQTSSIGKVRADAIKGKLFSRVTKEIISAVKQGGPDPKSNPKLRLVLLKAKEVNLPNENIERNIKKASSADQADFVEMTYELYGHGGVRHFSRYHDRQQK